MLESGGGQEGVYGLLLAVADFEEEPAAGSERSEGGRDETAVDFEAVVAGEEGEMGFVVADLNGKRREVFGRDVGRIGDDEVELLAGDGSEEIALEKADGDGVEVGVFAGNGEGGG